MVSDAVRGRPSEAGDTGARLGRAVAPDLVGAGEGAAGVGLAVVVAVRGATPSVAPGVEAVAHPVNARVVKVQAATARTRSMVLPRYVVATHPQPP